MAQNDHLYIGKKGESGSRQFLHGNLNFMDIFYSYFIIIIFIDYLERDHSTQIYFNADRTGRFVENWPT